MPLYPPPARPEFSWIRTPKGWRDGWDAALAASGTTPAIVAFIGDSITQGKRSTDNYTQSWKAKVRAHLLAGATPAWDYWSPADYGGASTNIAWVGAPPFGGNGVLSHTGIGSGMRWSGSAATATTTLNNGGVLAAGATSCVVTSGTGITVNQLMTIGVGAGVQDCVRVTAVSGTTITFTPGTVFGHADGSAVRAAAGTFLSPYPCTAIDLITQHPFSGSSGANFGYSVDGAATVTPTIAAGDAVTVGCGHRTSITGLNGAYPHTVELISESASNCVCLNGCIAYPAGSPGTGLAFVHGNLSGQSASEYFQNRFNNGGGPDGVTARYQALMGLKTDGTAGFGAPAGAALAFIQFGINDCTTPQSGASPGGGPDEFGATLTLLIDALRYANPNCSVCIIAASNPASQTSDQTAPFGNAQWYGHYAERMSNVAHSRSAAFVNFNAKWGSTPVGLGFQSAGDGHPINAGHTDMSNVLNQIV